MKLSYAAATALVAMLPTTSFAQEAFIAQIGGPDTFLSATISLPSTPSVDLSPIVTSLTAPTLAAPAPSFDTSAFPIIELSDTGSRAEVLSNGDNNTASILQFGINAASISQTGFQLSATVSQTGAGNRASVYQTGRGNTALVSQTGSGNTALVVQN